MNLEKILQYRRAVRGHNTSQSIDTERVKKRITINPISTYQLQYAALGSPSYRQS